MKKLLIITLSSLSILTACGTSTATPPPSPATTSTPTKPATATKPTQIAPGVSVTTVPFSPYKIFLISLGDNGQSGQLTGCGDSIVAIDGKPDSALIRTDDRIRQALTELLSIKTPDFGESGLTDTLANSDLKIDSVNFDTSNKATIKLSGKLSLAGECDNPRVKAQLEEIVKQFAEVKSLEIFINDKTLDEATSLKN